MSSMQLPALSSSGNGLGSYLREIQKFPILDQEEEYMLARRYLDHDDMSAAHRLVTSHLRLVVKIAMRFRGYGLPVSEMISEGNIGLMQAVKRFDPEKGFRLSTYAIWWIKAAIQEYILKSWSLVKMGTSLAQKRLFFNLKKIKNRLQVFDSNDLSPENVTYIAKELDVGEDDVIAMNQRMTASDKALNGVMSHDSNSEWMDMLVDDTMDQETDLGEKQEYEYQSDLLQHAIESLKDREKDIFVRRRLNDPPETLEDLSKVYGVSRERIRQIEVRAFEKVKEAVAEQQAA